MGAAESAELVRRLNELEKRVDILEARGEDASSAPQTTKPMAIREFINVKAPKTANDQGLTIGFYLEHHMAYESFNTDDLKAAFRAAKIPAPKNVNDMVNKNTAKGYMMDAGAGKGGKKAWVLTATGEGVVGQGFAVEK